MRNHVSEPQLWHLVVEGTQAQDFMIMDNDKYTRVSILG